MAKKNIFRPTEAETVKLIELTTRNGKAVDLVFGPSGAWIEWPAGDPKPWEVEAVEVMRGVPLVGRDGDGI